MITDVETGYIAGFLDGEGTAGLNKQERKEMIDGFDLTPVVKFCNNSHDALSWIKEKLELRGKIHPRPHYDGRKQSYELSTSQREKVIEILELLESCLIVKKQQARLLIEYCKSRRNKLLIKRKTNGTFESLKLESYSKRELEIFNHLKQLNHRGC